jgi:methionine synthase II (cobalamin-independent)
MPHAQAPIVHAETIGSLRHPEDLIKARQDDEAKVITRDALQAVEDRAVRDAVALQERLGFKLVTDGELRRNTYIDLVLDGMTGVRLEWQVRDQSGGYRGFRDGHAAGNHGSLSRQRVALRYGQVALRA